MTHWIRNKRQFSHHFDHSEIGLYIICAAPIFKCGCMLLLVQQVLQRSWCTQISCARKGIIAFVNCTNRAKSLIVLTNLFTKCISSPFLRIHRKTDANWNPPNTINRLIWNAQFIDFSIILPITNTFKNSQKTKLINLPKSITMKI